MPARTAHFFDLGGASKVSRRLARWLESGTGPDVSITARIQDRSWSDRLQTLLETSATASQLWERLLDWALDELTAAGTFVLDRHGFVIASRFRRESVLPPEVFSAVFAEGCTVLGPYFGESQRVVQQEFRIEGIGWIVLLRRELAGAPVLFAVWRETPVRQRLLERTWDRIARTIVLYDELFRSQGMGEAGG